jgi:hypothetical protein
VTDPFLRADKDDPRFIAFGAKDRGDTESRPKP